MNKNYYAAEIARFDSNGYGEGRGWLFYVSPGKYTAFAVEAAKEILEWGQKNSRTVLEKK